MKQKTGAILLLLLAIGCVILGAASGQPAEIMRTAINICLECVGIG